MYLRGFGSRISSTIGKGERKYLGELLIVSIIEGETAKTRELLESGANPNYIGDEGISPLMYSVSENRLDIARLLLVHGAHVASRTEKYGSSIEMSIGRGRKEITDLLIRHIESMECMVELMTDEEGDEGSD